MPRAKKTEGLAPDQPEEKKEAAKESEEAPSEEQSEYRVKATHGQLPYANYIRSFSNKTDAEAWAKRFGGEFI